MRRTLEQATEGREAEFWHSAAVVLIGAGKAGVAPVLDGRRPPGGEPGWEEGGPQAHCWRCDGQRRMQKAWNRRGWECSLCGEAPAWAPMTRREIAALADATP